MRTNCVACGSERLLEGINLGEMPNSNGLAESKETASAAKSYSLNYYWCENCGLLQLVNVAKRDELWKDYTYQSGVNKALIEYLAERARLLFRAVKKKELAYVIASNDGTEIAPLKLGFKKVIGIDPAKNMTDIANSKGLTSINAYFSEELGIKLAQDGKADLITANNVFAHVPDPADMMRGIKALLADDGYAVIEVQSLRSVLKGLSFDTLYAEHHYEWSIKGMHELTKRCGLVLTNVTYLASQQGGSVRFWIRKTGMEFPTEKEEKEFAYIKNHIPNFQKRADRRKRKFVRLIKKLKKDGKTISIWGSSAKINTLVNYCGLTSEDIACAYEVADSKIGKYMPKAGIPIKNEAGILTDMSDYLIVGAWNYMDFAKKKLSAYLEKGGQLINPHTCKIEA
ncbi:MAG: class I SAM-dependent methyltransferase [Candidatus Micrarchaeota archaeon]|nr:class I SAM-dependent methyltransferase [Candidatus Micrarchaeota archaeon]